MKTGETVKARTHAELINKLLRTNLKKLYRCTYDIDKNTFIWMVNLNDTRNAGHRNRIENNTTIIEEFDKSRPKDERFYHGLKRKHRLVFEKINTPNGRIYKFHGLYKLVKTENDDYIRILQIECDKYIFEGEL